jgi:hypothetical protein
MAVVHIHIERTGGVSLQDLYEKKYPGPDMLWYSTRDMLFAPFNIKTANYTEDWQLKLYAFIAERIPPLRHLLLMLRTSRRRRASIKPEHLANCATVVIGHFAADQVISFLSPREHSYSTVVREPLERMWSHYCYWKKHHGDVGHRVVPNFRMDMTFEEFSLLPEMQNYQCQAVGKDISLYEHIGVTESLDTFARETGLLGTSQSMPSVNHFSDDLPPLDGKFVRTFRETHAKDYLLYNQVRSRVIPNSVM